MNEAFHSSNSVAGVEGGAGWRPQSLSNLIMAIFSDTLSVTSGLSFCEVPAGRRGDGVAALKTAGSLEKRPGGE